MKKSFGLAMVIVFVMVTAIFATCSATEVKIVSPDGLPRGIVGVEQVAEAYEHNRSKPKYQQDKSLVLKYGPLAIRYYAGTVTEIATKADDNGLWEIILGPYDPKSNTDVKGFFSVEKKDLGKFKVGKTVVVHLSIYPVAVATLFGGPFMASLINVDTVLVVDGGGGISGLTIGLGILILALAGAGFYLWKRKKAGTLNANDMVKQAAETVSKLKDNVSVEDITTRAEDVKKKATETIEKIKAVTKGEE